MTKEQVQQHGDVIKWLCDNPDKGVWYKWENILGTKWEHSTILRFEADDCEGGEIVSIIPNDEYAEFRKAQIDGNIIQCCIKPEYGNGLWGTLDEDYYDKLGVFNYRYNYRIKPEETKFKVGDCVKIKDSYELLPHQKRIFVVDFIDDYNNLFGTNKDTEYSNANYCELWEPEVDEYCWFIDSVKDRVSFVKYKGFKNGEYYGIDTQYHDMIYSRVIEPFIGTLPSAIKDEQCTNT